MQVRHEEGEVGVRVAECGLIEVDEPELVVVDEELLGVAVAVRGDGTTGRAGQARRDGLGDRGEELLLGGEKCPDIRRQRAQRHGVARGVAPRPAITRAGVQCGDGAPDAAQ